MDEVHGVALGEGERLASEPADALSEGEVESLDMVCLSFFGTAQSTAILGFFCCLHMTTTHPTPAHHLLGRAKESLAPALREMNRATSHGLFLSHLMRVGRETPKILWMPRIEGRSL